MPYIDPEVILEAKKMDLLTYLQNYDPQELVRVSGDPYCTRAHDSLKISNDKWCWFSRGVGGKSALDYLIKVQGMSFTDAVEQIMGRAAIQPPVLIPRPQGRKDALFYLPKRDCGQAMAERYLHKRSISNNVIHFCTEFKLLYQTHRNGYFNVVFIGYDMANTPRYATIRGLDSDFKGDVAGSNKNYSFAIPNGGEDLHLFESAIDLLSFASFQDIGYVAGANCFYEDMLSLSGVYKPKQHIEDSTLPPALTQYLADHPKIRHVHLHLDNDLAGRQATEAIMAVLPKQYTAVDEPPPSGKDYNDYRCDCLGLPRYQSKERSFAR
ncbi:MAG: DUF3991 and TOPRIM domain-containing protein [Ethanoligenens sp.]